MTDTPKKRRAEAELANTLSLTKTVESGKVTQNFQRGRSKTVTVEVKKTRTFTNRPGQTGGMVEVERGNRRYEQRLLNQAEREAHFGPAAAEKAEDERPWSQPRISPAITIATMIHRKAHWDIAAAAASAMESNKSIARTPMDDLAAKNLAALRNAPSKPFQRHQHGGQTAKPRPNFAPAAPRVIEEEAAAEKKKARGWRRGGVATTVPGKLTIAQGWAWTTISRCARWP